MNKKLIIASADHGKQFLQTHADFLLVGDVGTLVRQFPPATDILKVGITDELLPVLLAVARYHQMILQTIPPQLVDDDKSWTFSLRGIDVCDEADILGTADRTQTEQQHAPIEDDALIGEIE